MSTLPLVDDAAWVRRRLKQHAPHKVWWRHWSRRAAVTAVLSARPSGVGVLLMKRAEREGDPWSGHMSFPGGRHEPRDAHVYETAIRELHEETGLNIFESGTHLGRLGDLVARPWRLWKRPLVISAFTFWVDGEPAWQLDPAEVDHVLWVPLAFLADDANRETLTLKRAGLNFDLPCYRYRERLIWGLTLRMLDELLAVVRGNDYRVGRPTAVE